ncbi:unnamed protein product, partial [Cladocopium goreaui]
MLQTIPTGYFREEDDFNTRRKCIDNAPLNTSQFCTTHGGYCPLLREVDVDMSGLPCEDNSRANFKRKFLQGGKFGSCYLVWAKQHRHMRTPLLILENTPDIKANEILELLGGEYRMLQLFVEPWHAGDRVEYSLTWSAHSGRIPTFRKTSAKFVHRQSMKLLTGQDKLGALAWPVTKSVASNLGTTVMPSIDPQ